MRTKNTLTSLALLLSGFLLGWVSRPFWFEPTANVNDLPNAVSTPVTGIDTISKSTIQAPQTSRFHLLTEPEKSIAKSMPFQEKFARLLLEGRFEEAMSFYGELALVSEAKTSLLKSIVLEQLYSALEMGDSERFVNLADAFLADYYDDIEVLLALAEFNQRSRYREDAIQVFQIAFTYAYGDSEKQQVTATFRDFVHKTDQHFSELGKWQDLLYFYETISNADLMQPQYQLRQAEIYLHTSDYLRSSELLMPLARQPQWQVQAESLLAAIEQKTQLPAAQDQSAHTIALEQRGEHYIVDASLGDEAGLKLLVDTGASITSISRRRFEQLQGSVDFTEMGTRLFSTANGMTKGSVYQVRQFNLGHFTLADVDLTVLEYDAGNNIDGLLGMNVLRNFHFELDQDEVALRLQAR